VIESLQAFAETLRAHPNVDEKLRIYSSYSGALPVAGGIDIGDDAAAIPDGDGFLLIAAEGLMESFIELDPWFAGYCAIMVNLSDIAAMGGKPTALVDVLWAHHDSGIAREVWAGMQAASLAYGVPIVGGHTTRFPIERTPLLAAAVIGRAKKLISSFTARPGEALLMAVDLRAAYRGEKTLFWNASVGSPPERLRGDLNILCHLAEQELVTAGKDISNGGILGTLAMLLATSRCGATVDLAALPMPPDADLMRWMLAFPSYGYLLTAKSELSPQVCGCFHERGIACAVIGSIDSGHSLDLIFQGQRVAFSQISSPQAA
jgi:AIR synthase-related protein